MANTKTQAQRRTRNDPRKEATRVAILETAEALFAQSGIDGVSLRQIGSAIGSANTGVVAYHFGGKEALVEAIFHHRLPGIEVRRRELLEKARAGKRNPDVGALLRALWLPLAEQVNSQGLHSYAQFMGALMHSSMGSVRLGLNSDYPTTNELAENLMDAMPKALADQFDSRMLIVTLMVTGSLRMIDESGGRMNAEQMFEDTLQMAAAALVAPTTENRAP